MGFAAGRKAEHEICAETYAVLRGNGGRVVYKVCAQVIDVEANRVGCGQTAFVSGAHCPGEAGFISSEIHLIHRDGAIDHAHADESAGKDARVASSSHSKHGAGESAQHGTRMAGLDITSGMVKAGVHSRRPTRINRNHCGGVNAIETDGGFSCKAQVEETVADREVSRSSLGGGRGAALGEQSNSDRAHENG